jgi:hypothetical protein
MPRQFPQHQPSCVDGGSFWRKGRNAGGNQIGIDEHRTSGLTWQELTSKRGFAGSIWAGDDDDTGLYGHLHTSSAYELCFKGIPSSAERAPTWLAAA